MEALREFIHELNLLPLNAPAVALKIGVAFVCGVFVAFLYRGLRVFVWVI